MDAVYKVEYSLDDGATRHPVKEETVRPRERSDAAGGIQKWVHVPGLPKINLKKKKGGCRDASGNWKDFEMGPLTVADRQVRLYATLKEEEAGQ